MADKTESGQIRRRLRSSTVVLGGMGALAAALTSCGSEPDKRCVDPKSYDSVLGYRVVSAARCSPAKGTPGTTTTGRWYYGSGSSGRYVEGGTFSKSQAVDRGGFGCSGPGSRHGSSGG
ncbi:MULTISPECIES: hypothetical protein [Streptomyces]|uniref:Lipoprotein n=2 Tax=Streptomyces TaxID=1883 RepID=A0A2N8P4V2_STRNR|nr:MULTISPECIES: hypothetical protein [Streptomyces]PNE36053.1 hypothetical protein AOB60_38525 [Streptomyces noursei]SHN15373.1 hypothetical protein SAMN05216268_121147 [Streptomyces yunnanensis]